MKKRLRESEATARRIKEDLRNKTKHFEETVIHLKEKLVDADVKLKRQRAETDTQMKSVINRYDSHFRFKSVMKYNPKYTLRTLLIN